MEVDSAVEDPLGTPNGTGLRVFRVFINRAGRSESQKPACPGGLGPWHSLVLWPGPAAAHLSVPCNAISSPVPALGTRAVVLLREPGRVCERSTPHSHSRGTTSFFPRLQLFVFARKESSDLPRATLPRKLVTALRKEARVGVVGEERRDLV